ncbi:SDR family NAD(P)-dependent oxidoreductase [Microbaculum marinum]|uniref:SDR family NAD(P)-dependent oxidoreductase n=1 Tax=Microbaculum marinum TaxID=1764581 RepID=A0AAW9RSQ0_9HYPH
MKAEDLFDLTGRVAIVTGAAGGLGLSMAEVLAANGATVSLFDFDEDGLRQSVERLRDQGLDVEGRLVDVADTDRLAAEIDAVAETYGRLDIAIANAGMSAGPGFTVPEGRMQAVDMNRWQRVIDVNLTATFVTIRAAAAHMIPRREGRIIAVSSIAGLMAEPLCGYAYAATKASVVNLVRQSAMELAQHNVLVTGIAPGPFRTNIGGGRINDPEVERMFRAGVPLDRIAHVDEMKGLVLLLASPASSFMTGVTIPIDGGATAD